MSEFSDIRLEKKLGALEALLYAANTPLREDFLAGVLKLEPPEFESLVSCFEAELERRGRGLTLVRAGDGLTLVTKGEFGPLIKSLAEYRNSALSRAALETLSIIAFRQPVSKGEIDRIRGTQSDQVLQTLLHRGLVEIFLDEKEEGGRPIRMVRTTRKFLFYFGLTRDFEMEQHFKKLLSTRRDNEETQDPGEGTP